MNEKNGTINWPKYTYCMEKILQDMLMQNELTDVTLICDDKRQFKAHKIVLSACSLVFKNIFNENRQNSSVIYLTEVQYQEKESILEYMYLGVVTFDNERMNEFLNIAKSLDIKGINDENITFDKSDMVGLDSEETEDTENNESSNNTEIQVILNCDHCESQFAGEGNLKKHIHSKHEGMKFANNQSEHDNKQHNNEGIKYICFECKYVTKRHQFCSERRFKAHIQSKHGGKYQHSCNQCDKKYGTLSHLKEHVKAKHSNDRYDCNICDFKAAYKSVLKIHIKSKHEGVIYACDQCAYTIGNKSLLKRHIEAKHECIKYDCDQCDKQFTVLKGLKLHIQSIHEGIKVDCNQCNKQFSNPGYLKIHIQSKHEGVKKYSCN